MNGHWISGCAFTLLENGEAYFPRVFEVIAQARQEVLLETFILVDDEIGQALQRALIMAAQGGADVSVLLDGYGSAALSRAFLTRMTQAGIRVHLFDPQPHIFGLRTNFFRRMHRKIVVVDGKIAFVGGINFSADHCAAFGPGAKQDYAVEIQGPIVATIQRFAHRTIVSMARHAGSQGCDGAQTYQAMQACSASSEVLPYFDTNQRVHHAQTKRYADAMFVIRDNEKHRNDIEDHYRAAIRHARTEVIIANAYFFPGYRVLREIRQAAKRGVQVYLILQGEPDLPIVKVAAAMLYDYLNVTGVHIYEYCRRPLHGKVACVDANWATVGSSNLDPLSLALNLEANVMIQGKEFASMLRDRLWTLITRDCHPPKPVPAHRRKWRRLLFSVFIYHFLRRFPAWAGWLPAHKPKLQAWKAPAGDSDAS